MPAAVWAAASRRTWSSLTQPIYWSARSATAAWALARVAAIAALSLSRLLESLISAPIFAYRIRGYADCGRDRGSSHQTGRPRTEENKYELQSLMRNSYAVIYLKKNTTKSIAL